MNNDIEYMTEKQKFFVYYKQNILPSLQLLEQKRKKHLVSFFIICLLVVLWITYGILNPSYMQTEKESLFWLLICFGTFFALLPMFSYYKNSKERILPMIINYFGKFEYIYQPEIPSILLDKSLIIKKHDKMTTDDVFNGEYENIPVMIMEYNQYNLKKTKESVKYIKKRQGIIFKAEMNKDFRGQTIIVKDKGILNKFTKYGGLEKVGLEYPDFEKKFEVYSDDQIEARYVLTTVMMEYISEITKTFPNIELSFFDKQVIIDIQMKENFFECSHFFRSLINTKRTEENFRQLYLLFSVIHTLKLNQQSLL